uniref:Uncharacterized protein n=1 Tax=viral metagenome TaxID=1070528 RepID=A0A6M3LL38_9ZZZZ
MRIIQGNTYLLHGPQGWSLVLGGSIMLSHGAGIYPEAKAREMYNNYRKFNRGLSAEPRIIYQAAS